MKLCNLQVNGETHLGLVTGRGVVDAAAAGCALSMEDLLVGADRAPLEAIAADASAEDTVRDAPRLARTADARSFPTLN